VLKDAIDIASRTWGTSSMLLADMDALPVEEATGLDYASKMTAVDRTGKTVPVMHACGHDMHVTWLTAAATLMAQARDSWRGTLVALFQPAEETGEGAQAMVNDHLFGHLILQHMGRHLRPRSSRLRYRLGPVAAAA
jgi:metal-dependent amidase/aminoacylase/carboxypeptidase family protein